MPSIAPLKNVVIVGGSYVGLNTASELTKVLPSQYRVIVVEKNSHFGHLFAYPRLAVAPQHEHKAFIPYTKSLVQPHRVVQARVTNVHRDSVELDRSIELGDAKQVNEIPYEALVLATGTHLASPGTLPLSQKVEGVESLRSFQKRVEQAKSIVILGGGAVGVQLASDIGVLYPEKEVTLVHSREQLMPRFHPGLSDLIKKRFEELGIKTVLGSRAVVPEGGWPTEGSVIVKTQDGRVVNADLVLQSTGQSPNSQILSSFAPKAIAENGFIKVQPSLQIDNGTANSDERIFAVGDIADSGAPKAARPAMTAAGIVARNVVRVLEQSDEPLETYIGSEIPSGIHLTLGIKESVIFRNPKSTNAASGSKDAVKRYVGEPVVMWKDDGALDMHIEGVWARRAPGITDFWA